MLELAINAGIPIVTCHTTDLLNLPEVLQHISTRPQYEFKGGTVKFTPNPKSLYVAMSIPKVDKLVYKEFLSTDSTLLLVNPDEDIPLAFNAGEVPVPTELMAHYLSAVTEEVDTFIRLASGLTIKEAVEVIKIAQAKDGALTPDGFRAVRARVAGAQRGLIQVPAEGGFYMPNPQLVQWMSSNVDYFLKATDTRLIPRGLLFDGPPGTGKTRGAKHLASEWGVPLYRLDLSSTLGKYVGESEGNLTNVLDVVVREAPCILLIDEVEKLFGERDDSGVTSRLLSQLLWWLQEHTSKVLTIMTTNDRDALPPELVRAGRIDREIYMGCLNEPTGQKFAATVLDQFILDLTADAPDNELTKFGIVTYADHLREEVEAAYGDLTGKYVGGVFTEHDTTVTQVLSHAELIALVHDLIKARKWV
jgi:hypothetical protein